MDGRSNRRNKAAFFNFTSVARRGLARNRYPQDPNTVEPRFNETLFNELLDITNDILCPGQSYSKMYGIDPRYNEPRYNKFFDITNTILIIRTKLKRKISLDITNCNVNTRQKINAEQIQQSTNPGF